MDMETKKRIDEVNKEYGSIIINLVDKLRESTGAELKQEYCDLAYAEINAVTRLAYRLFHSDCHKKIDKVKDSALEILSFHEKKIK
jgi:hypothetical protein